MFRPIKRAAKSSISEVIEEQRKLYGMVSPKELLEPETGSISNIHAWLLKHLQASLEFLISLQ